MAEEIQKKVVLRHVAERAGVSLGTASNVFANKPGVARKTRDSVIQAAHELGYHPATHPAGPTRTQTPTPAAVHTIAFLLRSTITTPFVNHFYSHVLFGVEQACTERGLSLLYATVDEHSRQQRQLPQMIQKKQVQGLLVVGYFDPEFFKLLQETGIPFVMVDHVSESLPADSVETENERGGYLATRYLLERVPQAVPAMITGWEKHTSFHERWRGYCRALADFGIPYDARYVHPIDDNGYTSMQRLLDLPVPPNAVFCCNDQAALGALSALHERKIAVPDACSIVGFDDIDMASHTIPPLTTVRVDKELLGAEGVRALLERIALPDMTPRHTRISVNLIERESVRSNTNSPLTI